MNQFTVRPDRVHGSAAPRGHLAWALTPRALWLLLAGAVFLVPAFFQARFAWGMLAWDLCVVIVVLIDGARLPAPRQIEATREWLSAPSLGREVEVELVIAQHGRSLIHCTLLDDLPAPFLEEPVSHRLAAYPEAPASVRYSFIPAQRGDHTTGKLYVRYRSTIGLTERWAIAGLRKLCASIPRCGRPKKIASI